MQFIDVSIIVPVGAGEQAWRELLPVLARLAPGAEIIVAATAGDGRPADLPEDAAWLQAPAGRARQLNAGAQAATRRFVWFVHADTQLRAAAVDALGAALRKRPAALHYFNLRFHDGPPAMWLNTAGVYVRSHAMGIPFGDQGFCMARAAFLALGGYDEGVPFGEDHLFVWTARQAGVALRCTGGWLSTSARKYARHGWLKTTYRHMRLTARQAWPEAGKLLRGRP